MRVDVLSVVDLVLYLVQVLKARTLWPLLDLGSPMLCLLTPILLPDPVEEHLADDLILDMFFDKLLFLDALGVRDGLGVLQRGVLRLNC